LLQLQRLKTTVLGDVTVLAISPDPPEKTKELLEKLRSSKGVTLTHRFLSDPELKAVDAWGIRNTDAKKAIPHPTTILFDRAGREVWRFTEKDFKKRPTDAEISSAVKLLQEPR
jgi:peroxiredoxin